MRISRATKRHVARLAELMAASPLLQRYGVTERGARTSLTDGLRARDLLLVVEHRGVIDAFAWVVVSRALDRSAYLRLLLVANGKRSGGIGAALLADVERRARAAGCRHMVLLVTTTNRRARAFYARQGYRRVGSLPDFARPGIGETLMEKALAARRDVTRS